MTESSLTQDLKLEIAKAMHGVVLIKHADKYQSGVPDFTATWLRITSWWEVKFWNEGDFESPAIQELTCKRLARQGLCFYIIYEIRNGDRSIRIVRPELLSQWRSHPPKQGFNHKWVATQIRRLHEGRNVA